MEELNEIFYSKAKELTDMLYKNGLITIDEYNKINELNAHSFSPAYVELFPKTLDNTSVQR